jgi:hypothetical protein
MTQKAIQRTGISWNVYLRMVYQTNILRIIKNRDIPRLHLPPASFYRLANVHSQNVDRYHLKTDILDWPPITTIRGKSIIVSALNN